MHPVVLFLLAILSPLVLACACLGPLYAGIAAASYIIHGVGQKTNPLNDQLDNVFYMIDVYSKDFSFWTNHMAQADILHYSLPLIAIPLCGVFLSLWLTIKVASKLKLIFQMGALH